MDALPLKDAVDWALLNVMKSVNQSEGRLNVRGLPMVWGNRTELAQVFQNLIGNAIKYCSTEAPSIDIGVARQGGEKCVVYVRDNGMGIPAQYNERIFGAFKWLHGPEIPGTGIGLALCRRIIERHGGRIWIESVEGAGATFLFTLRLVEWSAASGFSAS